MYIAISEWNAELFPNSNVCKPSDIPQFQLFQGQNVSFQDFAYIAIPFFSIYLPSELENWIGSLNFPT